MKTLIKQIDEFALLIFNYFLNLKKKIFFFAAEC